MHFICVVLWSVQYIVTSEWDSSQNICKCKVYVLVVLSFVLGVGHCLSYKYLNIFKFAIEHLCV